MPNWCNYEMRVRGKKEKIEELQKIMTDNKLPRHFHRVSIDDVIDFNQKDGSFITHIIGQCAWSVYSCMFEGDCTYQNDDPKASTSLQKESERLELEIEVFSDEPGIGFQEHYHYDCGEELDNECNDCIHYFFDEDDVEELIEQEEACEGEEEKKAVFEDWKETYSYPRSMERSAVEAGCDYVIGGFGEPWCFTF